MDEESLPAHYAKRRPSRSWITWCTYLLLLIIGAVFGALASRLNRRYNENQNGGLPEDPAIPWYPPVSPPVPRDGDRLIGELADGVTPRTCLPRERDSGRRSL